MRRRKLQQFNTLRNQILVVFLLVMTVVLLVVGVTTFHIVSSLLKNNAEEQIEQTVTQANGRLEALYKQLDGITNQIATNMYVQQMLLKGTNGEYLGFRERQNLQQFVNSFQTYTDGIQSFELYTSDYKRVFPLDEIDLVHRLGSHWVIKAEEAKGKMVWIGRDPKSPHFFIVLRQIRLMDRWFSPGGYLLVRINPEYFPFNDYLASKTKKQGYIILADRDLTPIFSNFNGNSNEMLHVKQRTVRQNGEEYIVVKQTSPLTGWVLVIVTPVSAVTDGVAILKNTILFSGAVGFLIFFIFSLFLSTIVTQPILKLTKAMQRGKDGELRPSSPISSTVEINELNDTYNTLVENINHLIQVVYEKELVRSRAELKALQAQINPHFLFNTLDALYWSLVEKEEEELAQVVLNMSELFRYTVSNSKQDEWVTLYEEIEHIRRYMEVMKLRWGERLLWNIVVPASCLDVRIPKLLIQPLVENAVLHGIGNKIEPGIVWVTVEECRDAPDIIIKVVDDGYGMDEQTKKNVNEWLNNKSVSSAKRGGMALVNVNKRLQLYYGEERKLMIHSELGQGTMVVLKIPKSGEEG